MTITTLMKILYFIAIFPILAIIIGGMIVVIVLATHRGNY